MADAVDVSLIVNSVDRLHYPIKLPYLVAPSPRRTTQLLAKRLLKFLQLFVHLLEQLLVASRVHLLEARIKPMPTVWKGMFGDVIGVKSPYGLWRLVWLT
jgi:hypothetical protein